MDLPFDFSDLKKLGVLGVLLWVLVPTGTPDDVITVWLIGFLGDWYLLLVLAILVLAYLKLTWDE